MLDGLHLHFERLCLFRGQNALTVAEVVIRHGKDGFIVRHVADDTRHIRKSGKLACPLAAVACDDLIAAILAGTHQRGLVDACRLDRLHKPLHLRIVPDTKGMILERMQVRQVEIDNLLFFGTGGVSGRRRLRCDLRTSGSAALIHGRLLRGGLALGLFVPRFGRLGLIGSTPALLRWTSSAGLGGLVLFGGRLLLDRLFLLFGRLVTGGGKIHYLVGMCRGGIVLAGIRRLRLLHFSLGSFGSGRLLHLGMSNSVSGIRYGIAHFKERRVPLLSQHGRLRIGQNRLRSRRLRQGGIFYRGSGSLGGRGCLGNVFLIICHLQTSFSWHEKSQSADWPGGSDLPSWFIYENAARCPVGRRCSAKNFCRTSLKY